MSSSRPTSRRRGAVLALLTALLVLPQADVAAVEPPGLEGRDTHLTLLTSQDSDCYELWLARAGDMAAVAAVVPSRYGLTPLATPTGAVAARLRVIDTNCTVSVDRQRAARRATVSMVLAQISSRDGLATSGFYLLSIGTDDPVLAARYRQVGLPALYVTGMSTSVEPLSAAASRVRFSVSGDGLDHDLSALVAEPPSTTAPSTFTAYYDGPRGEVRLRDENALSPATLAVVDGSFADHSVVEPLILAPNFLTMKETRFGSSFVRGGWTRTVERLD